jgi:hypothetical protein
MFMLWFKICGKYTAFGGRMATPATKSPQPLLLQLSAD